MDILQLRDVRYTYQTQYQKVEALKGITHSFDPGLVHAIVGKSGSGKTTLLSLMAGLDLPTAGEVLCEGVSTAQMKLEQYRREKVAVIYQSFRLFPLLTVAENVMYPMELRGITAREAKGRAAQLVERVGLPPRPWTATPPCSPAASSSGWPSPGRWGWTPRSCWRTSPPATWTPPTARTSSAILQGLAHESGYCVVLVTHDQGLAEPGGPGAGTAGRRGGGRTGVRA